MIAEGFDDFGEEGSFEFAQVSLVPSLSTVLA
jgi:hypothetical protein